MTKDRIEWIEEICEKSGIPGSLRNNIRLIANDVYRLEHENKKLRHKIDSFSKELDTILTVDLNPDSEVKNINKKKKKNGNQNKEII